MEEVDMDGSESDQELTGNETDESEWASKVHEDVSSMFIWSTKIDIKHFVHVYRWHFSYTCTCK
jgi:hypothetical protein